METKIGAEGSLTGKECLATVAIHDSSVMYGRPPLGKGFFGVAAFESGAVMYPAFVCGPFSTAGPEGIRGPGSNHAHALEAQ